MVGSQGEVSVYNLSSDTPRPHIKPGVVTHADHPSTREAETGRPWCLLASQASQIDEHQAQRDPASNTKVESDRGRDRMLTKGMCTHVLTYICTCRNVYIHKCHTHKDNL